MHFDLLARIGGDDVMRRVLSEDATIRSWLDVEAALGRGLAAVGIIDGPTGDRIASACVLESIDRDRLWDEAANVGYPILPLVTMICERLPVEDAVYVHYGATTQDIMDSGLVLQVREALRRLDDLVGEIGDALASLVEEHRGSVMAARTHAMQAVPTTFGAKLAVFLDTFARHRARLAAASAEIEVVSLFGAGGTSAALGAQAPAVREAVAADLGLDDCGVPWHVARDRVLLVGQEAAAVAATCVRLGREVIDLARLEIGEVGEADGMLRGASSTMPQKANPISSELVVGFGAWAGAASAGLLRAVEAGHERAAGEWQVEWAALPATLAATAGALANARDLVVGLRVFPERMVQNLEVDGGRLMSEAYMIVLTPHLGRGPAHDLVYNAVRRSREHDVPLREAVRQTLTPEVWRDVEPVLPWPQGYLGTASAICDEALRHWKESGDPATRPLSVDREPPVSSMSAPTTETAPAVGTELKEHHS